MKPAVLIVEDEEAARYGMRRALEKEGYTILEAGTLDQARRAIEEGDPRALILDMKLNQESGIALLPELTARRNPPAVVVVTAHGTERIAVETIRLGAFDYLPKPFDVDELRLVVRNAVESARLRDENERLKSELTNSAGSFGEIIGESPAMKRVYSIVEKVAETGANVLITGESGTGKDMVAREIHRRSLRSGQFVALNCAALPQDLVESELFGHEKGAFTGATARRAGKFEIADKGTLFLDEVGDMSPSTQAKLLRVIEDKQFQRLGGNESLTSDARIISATNRNLEIEGPQGRFREDLYYRLSVVTIDLPALRDRRQDIPALARSFASRYGVAYRGRALAISDGVYKVLLEGEWPGNVRQLRNAIERAAVMCGTDEITLKDIGETSSSTSSRNEGSPSQVHVQVSTKLKLREAKHEFERRYIEKCLQEASGNITKAAAQLGMHRQSLQHKIKEIGLAKKFVLTE